MTEAEWLAATDPRPMLEPLRDPEEDAEFPRDKFTERKLRLYGHACCRRVEHLLVDERSRKALSLTESYADGLTTADELWHACNDAQDAEPGIGYGPERTAAQAVTCASCDDLGQIEDGAAPWAAEALAGGWSDEKQGVVNEDVYDSERRRQTELLRDIFGNPFRPVAADPGWRTSTVVALAQQMYESRDFSVMPVLADALQDAGCDHPDVLDHCRGPGPHVRGCWVVDLILDKS